MGLGGRELNLSIHSWLVLLEGLSNNVQLCDDEDKGGGDCEDNETV